MTSLLVLILVTLKPIHTSKKQSTPCLDGWLKRGLFEGTNIGVEEEDWDDELPSWVDAAQAASGVTMGKKKSVEPAEATFGFQRASRISVQTSTSLEIEALDNEYEATPMVTKGSSIVHRPTLLTYCSRACVELLGELFVTHFQ